MNICVGSSGYLVVISLSVLCMAISSALKQVCRPCNLFDMRMYVFVGLYIPYPTFSFFQCPSIAFMGGTNEPSV